MFFLAFKTFLKSDIPYLVLCVWQWNCTRQYNNNTSTRFSSCIRMSFSIINQNKTICFDSSVEIFWILKCCRIILKVHLRLKCIPPCTMAKQEMSSSNMNWSCTMKEMMMAKMILTMNLLLMDNKAPDLIVAMILSLTLTILMILTMNMNMRMNKS